MKTYHYCAMANVTHGQQYSSGLVTVQDLGVSGDYPGLCTLIAEHMKPPRLGEEIVLLSLTVIADQ